MALTNEQAKIAETIQNKYRRLVKKGKSHARIFAAMQDYMPGFKVLLDAGVAQEAAELYPGFQQFAKILEHLASAIQSGAIAVPGKPAAPGPTDRMSECRRQAAAIDLRMKQLAKEGVPVHDRIERMTPHIVDLQNIYTSTNDSQLLALTKEFPDFRRYAELMEEAAEAERRKPTRSYDGLPALPDHLKGQLASLLGTAAKLERDYQSVLDAAGTPAPASWVTPLTQLRSRWITDLARFRAAVQSAGLPSKSQDLILPALDNMERRIAELAARVKSE